MAPTSPSFANTVDSPSNEPTGDTQNADDTTTITTQVQQITADLDGDNDLDSIIKVNVSIHDIDE